VPASEFAGVPESIDPRLVVQLQGNPDGKAYDSNFIKSFISINFG
jgi:hypothetical protein